MPKFNNKNNKLSSLITSYLPKFIVNDFDKAPGSEQSLFATFVEAFIEFLEKPENPYGQMQSFQDNIDIDRCSDAFVQYFRSQFMPNIPKNIFCDERLLIKFIKEFYEAKGTEKSFKLLFRILYGKDIEIEYPNIFKTSNAKFERPKSIRLTNLNSDITVSEIKNFKGCLIEGSSSNSQAVVDDVIQFTSHSNIVSELILIPKTITSSFQNGEQIFDTNNVNLTAYISNTISKVYVEDRNLDYYQDFSLSELSSMNLIDFKLDRGSNYSVGENIQFSGNGNDGEFYVSSVDSGPIEQIYVSNSGTNYLISDKIKIVNDYLVIDNYYENNFSIGETIQGTQSKANATVRFWDSGNLKLWISEKQGDFFTRNNSPYFTESEQIIGLTSNTISTANDFRQNSGYGCSAKIEKVDANGNVQSISLITNGEHYNFLPYCEIVSVNGSGSQLQPFGSNIGSITSISVNNDGIGVSNGFGWGYTTNPDVVFPEKILYFSKKIESFLNDSIEDSVSGSNGAIFCRVTDSGTDSFENSAINVLDISNCAAIGLSEISAISNYTFYGKDEINFPSSLKNKLYDGKNVQEFAYTIKVDEAFSKWKNIVKKLVHPAGMRMTAEFPVNKNIDSDLSVDTGVSDSNIVSYLYYEKPIGIFANDVIDTVTIDSEGSLYGIGNVAYPDSNCAANLVTIGSFLNTPIEMLMQSYK